MATLNFSVRFNKATNKFVLTDSTDWAGQGISTANVNGVFTIQSPGSPSYYVNTDYSNSGCDIRIGVSLVNQTSINLPLDANSVLIAGSYTFVYSVYNSNLDEYYTLTQSVSNVSYVSPVVSIEQTVDCISPLFTSIDTTNYTVNSIVPTITRTHDVYFPAGSALFSTPLSGSTAQIQTQTFYTGTQSTTISTVLSYALASNFTLTDTVTGAKEVVVACDNRLCDIFCCVATLYRKLKNAQGINSVTYKSLLPTFDKVMSLVAFAREAWNCGKENLVNEVLQDILDAAECTEGCGCGDTPIQVTGLGNVLNNIVVEAADSSIEVVSDTVGITTTYTVKVSDALQNTINAGVVTTVTSVDDSIAITETGTNPKNYDLSVNKQISDNISFTVTLDYTNGAPNFISVSNVVIQSETPASPTFKTITAADITSSVSRGNGDFDNAINYFSITDFMVTPSTDYKVFLNTTTTQLAAGRVTAADVYKYLSLNNHQTYNKTAGTFSFNLPQLGDISPVINAGLVEPEYIFSIDFLITV